MAFQIMEQAVHILQNLRRGTPPQRLEAIRLAGRYVEQFNYFPEAVPLLIRLLRQENFPRLAAEAAWALWKFKDARAIPILLEKAKRAPHPLIQEKAIRALGLLEAEAALPLLRSIALTNPSALFALGFFKQKEDTPILKRALRHPLAPFRQEAVAAWLRLYRADPKCLSFLTKRKIFRKAFCRVEPSPVVRCETLHALFFIDPIRAERMTQKLCLTDPAWEVRRKCFALLGCWSSPKNERLCLQGTREISWKVRRQAAASLQKFAQEGKVWHGQAVSEALAIAAETFPGGNHEK